MKDMRITAEFILGFDPLPPVLLATPRDMSHILRRWLKSHQLNTSA
jgi:hypothetical protein